MIYKLAVIDFVIRNGLTQNMCSNSGLVSKASVNNLNNPDDLDRSGRMTQI